MVGKMEEHLTFSTMFSWWHYMILRVPVDFGHPLTAYELSLIRLPLAIRL